MRGHCRGAAVEFLSGTWDNLAVPRRVDRLTLEQLFYAAACAAAERCGAPPRYVELFRDDVADPEAVETLADRDPGFRVDLAALDDPLSFVAALAQYSSLGRVWGQIIDQLPATGIIAVPIRGSIQ